MYSVFKPNKIEDEEILSFIESSSAAIKSGTLGIITRCNRNPNQYVKMLLNDFKSYGIIKQTKNGVPIYLRKISSVPSLNEDGYLTEGLALINSYEGSKSFLYEQEFWDAWHSFVEEEGFIGWATIVIKNTQTHKALERIVELGLLGEKIQWNEISGLMKLRVTL